VKETEMVMAQGDIRHLDSDETLFFQRELESVKAQAFEKDYPELKGLALIPQSSEADEGAESIVYQEFDRTGIAKIIANYADDVPRADVTGKENISPVRSVGASFGYSVQDVRAATKAGRPLVPRKANAARAAIEQKLNRIVWEGDPTHGLVGVLRIPNTNLVVPATAAASPNGTGWNATSGKTPDEIQEDLGRLVDAVISNTNGVEVPDTVVMSLTELGYIRRTRQAAGTDTTILQFFMQNHPMIRSVEWAVELALGATGVAPSGAVGATNIAMAYKRDPDKLAFEVPMPTKFHPVETRGLEFITIGEARTGGVLAFKPLSIAFMEDI
jgi:hypothetical protein